MAGGNVIAVVGSVNMDLVVRVPNLPRLGESVAGAALEQIPGGKGANQAVAAARAGARVAHIGAFGNDSFARELRKCLRQEGISLRDCRTVDAPSGTALITVDRKGQNTLVVSAGANAAVSPQQVRAARPTLAKAGLVLLQREVPQATVATTALEAHRAGVPVLLNAAPAGKLERSTLARIHTLIVNETEAEVLLGRTLENLSDARSAALSLSRRVGGGSAIVTLGKRGAFVVVQGATAAVRIRAVKVRARDTTAAGDTFVGAFATRFLETGDALVAARFASAAAALAVTRVGAQPSIPTRGQIERLLRATA